MTAAIMRWAPRSRTEKASLINELEIRTERRHSLLLRAPRRLEWVAENLPPLQPREVLVRTEASAISIGSELPRYRSSERNKPPTRYPFMAGYESIGTVVARGSKVSTISVGDRVAGFYGHRTHGIAMEEKVISIPDGLSDELALLVILSCDVAKGIRKLGPKPEEPVLITGAGAIGLLTVFILKAYGIRAVDVVEPRKERLATVRRLGARSALTPREAAGKLDTYPVAFECSSRGAAFDFLQSKMLTGSRICVLSDGNIEPLALSPDFHEKELTVVGSSDGWDYQKHAEWYFEVVLEGYSYLEDIFELCVTADKLPSTFEKLANGSISPVKVLVEYR